MPAPYFLPDLSGENNRGGTPRRGSVGCPVRCRDAPKAPRLGPATLRPRPYPRRDPGPVRRTRGALALCKDSEAVAFLTRMRDWLSRQPRKQPVAEKSWECPGSRRPVVLRQVGE
jgi:hypothetical protein